MTPDRVAEHNRSSSGGRKFEIQQGRASTPRRRHRPAFSQLLRLLATWFQSLPVSSVSPLCVCVNSLFLSYKNT